MANRPMNRLEMWGWQFMSKGAIAMQQAFFNVGWQLCQGILLDLVENKGVATARKMKPMKLTETDVNKIMTKYKLANTATRDAIQDHVSSGKDESKIKMPSLSNKQITHRVTEMLNERLATHEEIIAEFSNTRKSRIDTILTTEFTKLPNGRYATKRLDALVLQLQKHIGADLVIVNSKLLALNYTSDEIHLMIEQSGFFTVSNDTLFNSEAVNEQHAVS